MKKYALREDVETVDICQCDHANSYHDFGFIDYILARKDNTGFCTICVCPKYKKEKSMLKKEYLDYQNAQRSRI